MTYEQPRYEDDEIPWKGMVPVKRYKHHTLFYRRSKGGGWFESLLNTEIDRKKGRS